MTFWKWKICWLRAWRTHGQIRRFFGIWLIKINKIAKKCYRRIYITPPYYILKRWMVATITATHTNRFTPHDRGEKSGFHPAGLWSWHIIPSSLLPISMEHTASYWLTSHTPPALALWKGETECRVFLCVVTMVRLKKNKTTLRNPCVQYKLQK